MGHTESSEANGVGCIECGIGLPRSNWTFEHPGDHGWVYVYFTVRNHSVHVSESVDIGASMQGIAPGMNLGFSKGRTASQVKALDYIRNRTKKKGYTCLECLHQNCHAGHAGRDRLLREANSLLRSHGIMVETTRIEAAGGRKDCKYFMWG
jgi:hypothetical protein